MMTELSFVIPAYNVEKYIERCLNSIYSQDVEESRYEVIVIDDGSTDSTVHLLREIQKEHENMQVVSQKNQGPSTARNKGIALSKGKFIWFVDSDDHIAEGSVTSLLSHVPDSDIDILYFTYNEVSMNGSIKQGPKQPVAKNILMSGKRALAEGFYPTSVWLALWNREYLNSLSLQFNTEIMYAEDSLFSFQALVQSHNVMFVDDAYYVYERREGSSTTKTGKEKLLKQKTSDIIVAKFIMDMSEEYREKDQELADMIACHSRKMTFGLLFEILKNRRTWKKLGISQSLIRIMEKYEMYPLRKPYGSLKKRIISQLLNQRQLMC